MAAKKRIKKKTPKGKKAGGKKKNRATYTEGGSRVG